MRLPRLSPHATLDKDTGFQGYEPPGVLTQKVQAEEIGPATQRFTPRWIVRFLVENSLGRLWVEMHPDSRLSESLAYLVPAQQLQNRPLKPAREITFLDPCCGSMHFGLVAFDLFVEMYREELDNASRPGWPDNPSVTSVDEIPSAIITHNLHGIDLDLRSIQLSALALFLRARTLNKSCPFTDSIPSSPRRRSVTPSTSGFYAGWARS